VNLVTRQSELLAGFPSSVLLIRLTVPDTASSSVSQVSEFAAPAGGTRVPGAAFAQDSASQDTAKQDTKKEDTAKTKKSKKMKKEKKDETKKDDKKPS